MCVAFTPQLCECYIVYFLFLCMLFFKKLGLYTARIQTFFQEYVGSGNNWIVTAMPLELINRNIIFHVIIQVSVLWSYSPDTHTYKLFDQNNKNVGQQNYISVI